MLEIIGIHFLTQRRKDAKIITYLQLLIHSFKEPAPQFLFHNLRNLRLPRLPCLPRRWEPSYRGGIRRPFLWGSSGRWYRGNLRMLL